MTAGSLTLTMRRKLLEGWVLAAMWAVSGCGDPASATTVPRTSLHGPPQLEAPGPDSPRFRGEVVERLHAGSYTYLQVATGDGHRWVVTMGKAPDGLVEVRSMGTQKNFHARRLDRDFDELVFGIVTAVTAGTDQS